MKAILEHADVKGRIKAIGAALIPEDFTPMKRAAAYSLLHRLVQISSRLGSNGARVVEDRSAAEEAFAAAKLALRIVDAGDVVGLDPSEAIDIFRARALAGLDLLANASVPAVLK